jgi:hypothetical protein
MSLQNPTISAQYNNRKNFPRYNTANKQSSYQNYNQNPSNQKTQPLDQQSTYQLKGDNLIKWKKHIDQLFAQHEVSETLIYQNYQEKCKQITQIQDHQAENDLEQFLEEVLDIEPSEYKEAVDIMLTQHGVKAIFNPSMQIVDQSVKSTFKLK